MGYYDVADILAEEEKVPVALRIPLQGIGLALDPAAAEEETVVRPGSKLDLPLWLLPTFVSRRFATILESKKFSNKLRREAQADAACVNLKAVSPFFYTYAAKILSLTAPGNDSQDLLAFLITTFVGRYNDIFLRYLSASGRDLGQVKRLLTREELEILESGLGSLARLQSWQQGQSSTLRVASVLGRSSSSKRAMPPAVPAPAGDRAREGVEDRNARARTT